MDDADMTADRMERDEAMRKLASAPAPVVRTGRCLSCDEPTGLRVYCNTDCRDQHEHQTKILKRQGRL